MKYQKPQDCRNELRGKVVSQEFRSSRFWLQAVNRFPGHRNPEQVLKREKLRSEASEFLSPPPQKRFQWFWDCLCSEDSPSLTFDVSAGLRIVENELERRVCMDLSYNVCWWCYRSYLSIQSVKTEQSSAKIGLEIPRRFLWDDLAPELISAILRLLILHLGLEIDPLGPVGVPRYLVYYSTPPTKGFSACSQKRPNRTHFVSSVGYSWSDFKIEPIDWSWENYLWKKSGLFEKTQKSVFFDFFHNFSSKIDVWVRFWSRIDRGDKKSPIRPFLAAGGKSLSRPLRMANLVSEDTYWSQSFDFWCAPAVLGHTEPLMSSGVRLSPQESTWKFQNRNSLDSIRKKGQQRNFDCVYRLSTRITPFN